MPAAACPVTSTRGSPPVTTMLAVPADPEPCPLCSSTTTVTADPPPLAVSVSRFADMLGIGERDAYQLARDGAVESRFYGRRRLIPVDSIRAFLASLPTSRP